MQMGRSCCTVKDIPREWELFNLAMDGGDFEAMYKIGNFLAGGAGDTGDAG